MISPTAPIDPYIDAFLAAVKAMGLKPFPDEALPAYRIFISQEAWDAIVAYWGWNDRPRYTSLLFGYRVGVSSNLHGDEIRVIRS